MATLNTPSPLQRARGGAKKGSISKRPSKATSVNCFLDKLKEVKRDLYILELAREEIAKSSAFDTKGKYFNVNDPRGMKTFHESELNRLNTYVMHRFNELGDIFADTSSYLRTSSYPVFHKCEALDVGKVGVLSDWGRALLNFMNDPKNGTWGNAIGPYVWGFLPQDKVSKEDRKELLDTVTKPFAEAQAITSRIALKYGVASNTIGAMLNDPNHSYLKTLVQDPKYALTKVLNEKVVDSGIVGSLVKWWFHANTGNGSLTRAVDRKGRPYVWAATIEPFRTASVSKKTYDGAPVPSRSVNGDKSLAQIVGSREKCDTLSENRGEAPLPCTNGDRFNFGALITPIGKLSVITGNTIDTLIKNKNTPQGVKDSLSALRSKFADSNHIDFLEKADKYLSVLTERTKALESEK